jgi:flavin reductase (DIM6/NTAB) family NADH-FMN oxidoreductase RutF
MLRGHADDATAIDPRAASARAGEDGLRVAFVEGMSRSAPPVYVVTTAGAAGVHGLTVGAVSSVSADPPTLLACVHRQSPLATAVRRNRVMAASLLGAGQAEIAEVFAGRHPGRTRADSFATDPWTVGPTGAPLFDSAAAGFDCRLLTAHDSGTHVILIGLVVQVATVPADPLLYHRRCYTAPAGAAMHLQHYRLV